MNYGYWLAQADGISDRVRRKLVEEAGSAEDVYFLPERSLKMLAGEAVAERLLLAKKNDTEADYARLGAAGISFLTPEDEAYPARLRQIFDPPYALYVKGRLPVRPDKSVAIVGARMCSEYGRVVAERLAHCLAQKGVCIVSGLARGIDAAGHRGAVDAGGVTCAVLGCGVDVCYPRANERLYGEILDRGCILSEYPPGTQPRPGYFPQRNRIIAGLVDAVVVVEAKERSGSLITADLAIEQGRDVYAVPGRMHDALSAGCNGLIRQGAGIVSNIEDFVRELGVWTEGEQKQSAGENLSLEKEERLVYSCVDLRPRGLEELLQKTGLSMPVLAESLTGLLRKGVIREVFKNDYIRQC